MTAGIVETVPILERKVAEHPRPSVFFMHEVECTVSSYVGLERVYSPSFLVSPSGEPSSRHEFKLLLFPRSHDSINHCSVYLQLVSSSSQYAYLNCTISLGTESHSIGWHKYDIGTDYGFKHFCAASTLQGTDAVFKLVLEVSTGEERNEGKHAPHSVSLCPDWRLASVEQTQVGFLIPEWLLARLPTHSRFPFVYQTTSGCCGDSSMLNVALSVGCGSVTQRTVQRVKSQTLNEVCQKLTRVMRDSSVLSEWELPSVWHASRGFEQFREQMVRLNTPCIRVLVNYKRCAGIGGWGHFGVLVGYVPAEWLLSCKETHNFPQVDFVCLFDPNPSYGLQLVPLPMLWDAVNTVDPDSKLPRGLLLLEHAHLKEDSLVLHV